MSKYTSEDPDVVAMDLGDRVQYEFDLLDHDVDKMVEASYAVMAMKDRSLIQEQMKSPRKIYIGVIMMLVQIFTILFVIMFLLWLILRILGSEYYAVNLGKIIISVFCMLALLIIITVTITSMQGNMTELVEMSKEPVKEE